MTIRSAWQHFGDFTFQMYEHVKNSAVFSGAQRVQQARKLFNYWNWTLRVYTLENKFVVKSTPQFTSWWQACLHIS